MSLLNEQSVVLTGNTGARIRAIRLKAGISQKQLAEKLNMTPQQLSQYERGTRSPKYGTLVKIASALGCRVSDLGIESWHNFQDGVKSIFLTNDYLEALYSAIEEYDVLLEGLTDDDIKKLRSYADFLRSQHYESGSTGKE